MNSSLGDFLSSSANRYLVFHPRSTVYLLQVFACDTAKEKKKENNNNNKKSFKSKIGNQIKVDSILKSRDITLPTKVRPVKAMVFPVVMYGCESWTIKKAESESRSVMSDSL